MLIPSLAAAAALALTAAALVLGPAAPAQAASLGPYYLMPWSSSDLCVQPQSENLANLTKLELATCRNVGAQKWWFRDSVSQDPKENLKLIVNGASHTCMNVRDAGPSGTPLVLYGCTDSISTRNNDIFKIEYEASQFGWEYYSLTDKSTKNPVFSGQVLGSDLITRSGQVIAGHRWTWIAAPS